MRKKNSDQLSLNLPTKTNPKAASAPSSEAVHKVARVFRLEEVQKKKEHVEESKYVKAILDLVRHYK
jgi:hypothetical protein